MRLVLVIACLAAALRPEPARGDPRQVDEDTAELLSVAGTGVSFALPSVLDSLCGRSSCKVLRGIAAVGVLVGPSVGHWYAEDWWTRGLGLRMLGAGVGLAIAGIDFKHCDGDPPGKCTGRILWAFTLAVAGGSLFLWGTIDDIATASDAARAHNDAVLAPLLTGQF
jgi:hypothetical protein